ncbi:MAG: 16S rRNA (cytidine(1402)-2'-O)-methyltransferase [Desulfobulbaceae bacterium]|nr:16S rRNA (cytidine(1402)-2'-O)-methyltransferase [Desulfobulbaceae bacterium]
MESKEKRGKLILVSTPIGNKDDFTIRAIEALKMSDFVICEELKMGANILRQINLTKEFYTLNEHNEQENASELIEIIKTGKTAALISDAGTPLFADPGRILLKLALKSDIEIEVVPGASSIMTAIVRCGFDLHEFVYAGFLSRDSDERVKKIKELSYERRTIILMDTPYRLLSLLEDLNKVMPERSAYLGMNLTMHYETHHYGTFSELYNKLKDEKIKSEFVICFEGNFNSSYKKQSSDRSEYSADNRDSRTGGGDRPPRRDYDDRPPRQDYGDRPPRREWSDKPPRKEYGDRPPRREWSDKPPRKEYGDRPPRKEYGDRPPRREWSDKPPHKEYGDRPPRKEFGDKPPRREWSDKPPRREWTDKPPRKEFGDRPPRKEYDDRPKREDGDFSRSRSSWSNDSERPPRKEFAGKPKVFGSGVKPFRPKKAGGDFPKKNRFTKRK